MRVLTLAGVVTGLSLLAGGAAGFWKVNSSKSTQPVNSLLQQSRFAKPGTPLAFGELLDPGPKLQPSAKARALNGQRVRLVGFMAKMEEPIIGGFYFVPRPLSLDESGAGTGDLPLESVLVLVPGSEGTAIPHLQGALEGTGILEVGNRSDGEGRVSNFRLKLDPDQRLASSR